MILEEPLYIEYIHLEIAFVLQNDFYYGPANHFTEIQWKTMRQALYAPQYPLYDKYVLTKDILADNAQELIKYYRNIENIAEKYQIDLINTSYFWIRPFMYSKSNINIHFPWHDTYEESQHYLRSLLSRKNGELFFDLDQGWQITINADEKHIFIKESDGECQNELIYKSIKTNREFIEEQAAIVLERLNAVIELLTSEFKVNYWQRQTS